MYSEEQPNQNPEKAEIKKAQDEKSEAVEIAVSKKDQPAKASRKKQISPKVKKDIISLLKDERTVMEEKTVMVSKTKADKPQKTVKKKIVEPAEKEVKAKKEKEAHESVKQLTVKDNADIKDLLSGKPIVKEVKEKPAKKQVHQISAEEKRAIIRMLHDASPEEEHPAIAEEIDYSDLNKQELVEVFEEVVQERDISKIKRQVGEINSAFHQQNKEEKDKALNDFIAGGGNKDDYKHIEDPLEQRFKAAFNVYKHNKSKYAEEVEHKKQDNLQHKLDILGELKELINSEETLKNTYDEFRRLQDRWKEIGMVPASELNNLWQNYHFLVERFFDKVRINKELRDLDLKKNFEQKILLCEKAEELLLEQSIIKSFKLLQKYHDEWREIGPVPSENREELWERFKAATDKINQRRKEHYKDIQEDQEKNLEAKTVLCEKAEELATAVASTLKEWQKKTDQINELFKTWKSIGRAPKAQNDEIWHRFKSSMDTFYNNKREFLGKLKEQQMDNLNLKIDLCVQAEALKDSEDWRNTTNELIRFQKEWRKIGPVPRRHSEKVWKRFRAACDEFFNRKSEFFKNIHVVEADNLTKKEELIKSISSFKVTKDKTKNLDALKEFQRNWIETGHVPFKEKDKIQRKYREAIDHLIDKMEIDRQELTQSDYKNKIEVLKGDPDADWKLQKERTHILNKIKKIKEDVAVLENNIGFFSSSKQSELFRKEFENKIDKAKSEIQSFEARLKMLNG